MIQLQNDFTTPEQSKRLLELGVPADSADMLWDGHIDSSERWVPDSYPRYLEHPYSVEIECDSELYISHVLPCWSVGRLIEIHTACAGASSSYYISAFPTNILNEVMWHLTEAVRHGWVDFSKLED